MQITFDDPRNVTPPGLDGVIYEFPFCFDAETAEDNINGVVEVSISGTLVSMWGFQRIRGANENLIEALYEYARRAAVDQAKAGTLSQHIEIPLRTDTAPHHAPHLSDSPLNQSKRVVKFEIPHDRPSQVHEPQTSATTQTEVMPGGQVIINNLPFREGELVEVVVRPRRPSDQPDRYPLRGSGSRYDDPFDSIIEGD